MIIRPEDIRKKVAAWYPAFLRAEISGEAFFPKSVPFARVKPVWVTQHFEELHRRLVQLRQHSKEVRGHGYTVAWEEVNNRTIGKNQFPTNIYVANQADYLSLLSAERQHHYRAFAAAWPLILRQFPRLKDWLPAQVKKIGDYGAVWPDLLRVCQWFVHHHEPDRYYIRELPVAVPTKFVEQHKPILSELLMQLLPADRIRSAFVGNRDHNFERRFGLKYDETLIRLRFLDATTTDQIDDMAIRHSTFARCPVDNETVIITENKMNFLTLPPWPRTLALWGGGFQVHLLRGAQWLHFRRIYYWGDLDTHGLYILSQLRGIFVHVKSLMMDEATFDKFYTGDHGPSIARVDTHGLHDEEQALFDRLRQDNLRLEQEKIPQWYVKQQLEAQLGSS